jgi:hypothetical protein
MKRIVMNRINLLGEIFSSSPKVEIDTNVGTVLYFDDSPYGCGLEEYLRNKNGKKIFTFTKIV